MVINIFTFLLVPHKLVWLAQTLYSVGFIPQIIKNYRIKTSKGLSDYFLIANLNGYLTLLYYVFCLNLPIAYKIMGPIQTTAIITIILQRLYYDNSKRSQIFGLIFIINTLLYMILFPLAFKDPYKIGHILGWTTFLIGFISLIPQLIKTILNKSATGLSFLFILFLGIAGATEVYAGILMEVPLQTIISGGRNIVYFLIFSILFLMYKNR